MEELIESFFIAIFGIVIVAVVYAVFITVPMYFLWNWAAPIYFNFLPAQWLNIPFWDMMGLNLLFGFIGNLIFKKSVTTNEKKK